MVGTAVVRSEQMQMAPSAVVVQRDASSACCASDEYYIHSPTMIGLGAVQLVLGAAAICFQIAATMNGAHTSDVSSGVWCGFVFMLAGAFGVAAGIRRSTGLAAAFCIMSIIAIFFTIPIFVVSGYGMKNAYEVRDTANGDKVYVRTHPRSAVRAGVNGGLIIIALLECAFALWSAIRAGISGFDCCDIPRKEKHSSNDIPLDGIAVGTGGVHVVSTDEEQHPTYKATLYHPVTIGVKVANGEDVDDEGVKSMSYDLYEQSQKF